MFPRIDKESRELPTEDIRKILGDEIIGRIATRPADNDRAVKLQEILRK